MPDPNPNESQDEYISRFMSSEEAQSSFPDIKQRLAVAYSKYRQSHGIKKKLNGMKKHSTKGG